MANRKITDLTALAAGSQATGDLLPIVDVSESAAVDKNKKISVENLFKGIPGNVGIGEASPSFPLDISGASNAAIRVHTTGTGGSDDTFIRCKIDGTTANNYIYFGDADANARGFIGYNHGFDYLRFHVAGSERVRITQLGRVGIGVTNPGRLLHIQSNQPVFRMQDTDGTNTYGEIQSAGGNSYYDARVDTGGGAHIFRSWDGSTYDEKVRITNIGRLGIGTINPTSALQVETSASNSVITLKRSDAATAGIMQLISGNTTNSITSQGNKPLFFATNNVERMRILSGGNVGIGLSNPSSKLHVKVDGTSQVIQTWQADLGTNDRNINLKGPTTDSATEPFTFQTANSIAFEIDSTERLKIGDNGEITASTTQLYLGETNSSTNELNIGLGRTTNGYAVIDLIGDATYTSYGLRIVRNNTGANASSEILHRGTGTLSINATDSGQVILAQNNVTRLSLRASDGKVIISNSAGARGSTGAVVTSPNDSCGATLRANGYIEWQTDVGAVGTNYFLSDQSLKENIVNASATASGVINGISFKEFDWKSEAGRTDHVDIGIVAQQVAEVEPSLTMTLSDGRMSINEPAFMTYTAKALQEALAEIETLKAKVAALEAQ